MERSTMGVTWRGYSGPTFLFFGADWKASNEELILTMFQFPCSSRTVKIPKLLRLKFQFVTLDTGFNTCPDSI